MKFKNSTEPDAWLKVAAFDSLDCINEYNRTKNIESNLLESETTEKAITEVNKNNLRIERKPKEKSNQKRKASNSNSNLPNQPKRKSDDKIMTLNNGNQLSPNDRVVDQKNPKLFLKH